MTYAASVIGRVDQPGTLLDKAIKIRRYAVEDIRRELAVYARHDVVAVAGVKAHDSLPRPAEPYGYHSLVSVAVTVRRWHYVAHKRAVELT